jgi:hypothetical protein
MTFPAISTIGAVGVAAGQLAGVAIPYSWILR